MWFIKAWNVDGALQNPTGGGSRIDAGLGCGVHGVGSISGANVLRARSGLVVLTDTVSWLSASEAQFLPDTMSLFRWG